MHTWKQLRSRYALLASAGWLLAGMRAASPVPHASPAVVAAGDIAVCGAPDDEATAAILDTTPGVVLPLGDEAYPDGRPADFTDCYGPSWGRYRARSRPVPGNHEYHTDDGAPYFAYFGAAAGERGKGWYSYDLGTWHVIALNSNVSMSARSPQLAWLRADLAATRARCVLAYWHEPRFSSGYHGGSRSVRAVWELLYGAGADLVLNAHDHDYERFAPQAPDGVPDPARGIREFVVGTGGVALRAFDALAPNSEARQLRHGVLRVELGDGGYAWSFVTAPQGVVTDRGTARCH